MTQEHKDEAVAGEELVVVDELPPIAVGASSPPVPSSAPAEGPLQGASSVAPPRVSRPAPPRPGEGDPVRKSVRPKLQLRIPDDEVARPLEVPAGTVPMTPVPPAAVDEALRPSTAPVPIAVRSLPPVLMPSQIPIAPSPIMMINGPSKPPAALPSPDETARDGISIYGLPEDSWTPYQPTVADRRFESQPGIGPGPDEFLVPDSMLDVPAFVETVETIELDVSEPPPALSGPEKPIVIPAHEPLRARLATEPDGEDVTFDDDELPPAEYVARPPTSSRADGEISTDDLVSVEELAPARSAASAPVLPAAPHVAPALAALAAPAVPPVRPRVASMPPAIPVGRSSSPGLNDAALSPPSSERIHVAPAVPPPAPGAPAPPLVAGETAASRKAKAKGWWDELFGEDFVRTMTTVSDADIAREVTFVEDSLSLQQGAIVLDLACGAGQHALELARRGYKVVGLDLSPTMLARAAQASAGKTEKVTWAQADMRELAFENAFDGVYCWNTSFGFFEEDKNAQILARIHKALKKSGQFLLDVANRDFVARQGPSLAWFEGEACICMDEMQLDWITSRLRVKRTMMSDEGRTREVEYSVRLYSLHELGKLLHDNGFRVTEVSGRTATPGVFFGTESPRTLVLAEKR